MVCPMSQTQNDIPDTDADFWLTQTDCEKRAEISLSPSEQRGRWLTIKASMEDTELHLVQPSSDEYAPWLCLASVAVAALTILLFGLVLAQVILLPDATVWPMGVAALICAGASAGLGWFGVRGLK